MALRTLMEDTGLSAAQTLTGLMALHQAQLAEVSLEPFAVRLIPVPRGTKANPLDTPLMHWLSRAGA